jgi:hypothetical protein
VFRFKMIGNLSRLRLQCLFDSVHLILHQC